MYRVEGFAAGTIGEEVEESATDATIDRRLREIGLAAWRNMSASMVGQPINQPTLEQYRSMAFLFAIEPGKENVVQMLLEEGSVPERDINFAFFCALERKLRNMVKLLLTHQPITLSLYDVRRSINTATSYGWKDIVAQLLATGFVDITGRSNALVCAIEYKHEDIAKLLLTNGPVVVEDVYRILCKLNDYGWEEIIEKLLGSFEFKNCVDRAVLAAVEERNFPVIERILVRGDLIDEPFRVRIISLAVEIGDVNKVKKWLASVDISENGIDSIIECGNAEVQKILEKYRSCQQRYTAIKTAITNRDIVAVKGLLAIAPLISWQILKLLTIAIHSKNHEAIEVILQSTQYINPKDFGRALEQVVVCDDANIARLVFDLTFFSKRIVQPLFLQKIVAAFPLETPLQLCSRALKNSIHCAT